MPKADKDLSEFLADTRLIKATAFDHLEMVSGMSKQDLLNAGYRSMESAFITLIQTYQLKVDKLERDFVRRYPD